MSKKLNRFPEILGTMMIIAFLSLLLGCGPKTIRQEERREREQEQERDL